MPKVPIWIQDPSQLFRSMDNQGIIEIDIDRPVEHMSRDEQIDVHGLHSVRSSDVSLESPANLSKREGVHCYAVARIVIDMYEALLQDDLSLFPYALNQRKELLWSWNQQGRTGGPLKIYPRAGIGLNAFFSHSNRALRFQYFPSGKIFACRSLDLVAHEVGHAVLDALKPGWWRASSRVQTSALHESFGDLTIIFLFLCHDTLVNHLYDNLKKEIEAYRVKEPNADLEVVLFELGLFVLNIGEELARARNALDDASTSSLRDFRKELKLSTVSNRNSAHSLSRVFTKAICLIIYNTFIALSGEAEPRLVNSFVPLRDSPEGQAKLAMLKQSGEVVARLMLAAMAKAPLKNALFVDIAEEMCRQAERFTPLPEGLTQQELHNAVREEFERCEILGREASRRPQYSFPQWCSSASEAHSMLTWPVRHVPKGGKPKRYSPSRLPLSSL